MNIVKHILTDEECDFIKNIDVIKHNKKWVEFQQGGVDVTLIKCNIKPFVTDIVKRLGFPENCYVELLHYRTGSLSKVHIDSSGDSHDSGSWVKQTWKTTSVILLNDDFTGGDLFFPRQNLVFDKTTKGDLITFMAGPNSQEYEHGVTKILTGDRYTMVIRVI